MEKQLGKSISRALQGGGTIADVPDLNSEIED